MNHIFIGVLNHDLLLALDDQEIKSIGGGEYLILKNTLNWLHRTQNKRTNQIYVSEELSAKVRMIVPAKNGSLMIIDKLLD